MNHIIEREIYGVEYKVVKVTTSYTKHQIYKTIKVFSNVKEATEFHFKQNNKDSYFYIITVNYKVKGKSNGN